MTDKFYYFLKCHFVLVAKQGELESRSFMPLPGDAGSIRLTIKAMIQKWLDAVSSTT